MLDAADLTIFRAALNSLPTLNWISNIDGERIFSNQALSTTLKDHHWQDAVHPDDLEGYLIVYHQSHQQRQPYTCEYRLKSDDFLSYRRVQEHGTPLYDQHNGFVGFSGCGITSAPIEEKLHESEERFRVLAELVPGIFYLTDHRGRCTYINPQFYQYTGLDEGTGLDSGWRHAVHSEDIEEHYRLWLEAVDNGTVFEREVRLRDKEGKYCWYFTRAKPVRSAGGDITHWIGITLEIDQLKTAQTLALQREQTVRRQLAEIEAIYDTAPIGLAVIDRELRYTRINQYLAAINGFSVEDHIGRTIREILPSFADQVEPMFQRILDTGEPVLNLELKGETLIQPDVTQIWLEHWIPLKDENNQVIGVNVVAEEATADKLRQRRAEILQQLTGQLLTMLTPAKISEFVAASALTALDARVANIGIIDEHEEMLENYSKSTVFGDEILHQYRRIPLALSAPMTDAIKQCQPIWIESPAQYEALYPHLEAGSGSQSWISIPLAVEDKVIGSLGMSFAKPRKFSEEERNFMLTLAHQCALALERARLFEAEKAARLEAEKAGRMKLQFLGMISHELRTPLTSIKGFATTLLAEDVEWDHDVQHSFLEIIDDEADKLTELVDQLLELSRMQGGTLRIDKEHYTPQAIMDGVMPQLKMMAVKHRLWISVDEHLPPVTVDARRVGQVITNLVSNAIKYSPPDTVIQISASPHADGVMFSVRDQGSGIPAEERELVFEPFHQAERQHKREGVGLGLAICKGIIEAHGGKIWIDAHVPAGTTVCFTL